MSFKKRRREKPIVDTQLVEIYEDLTNVDEQIRLKACYTLLSNFVLKESANGEQLNEILRRLLRGLCSSRKSARLGFSVALTEFLTELLGPKGKKIPGFFSVAKVISTFEEQTNISGNVSGQEERDHHFGRLFGTESIIRSGILFQSDVDESMWARILDLVFELAKKKPWLREGCGFILCNAIKIVGGRDSKYAQLMIEKLNSEGLNKTPEGIAVWLAAKDECPTLQFPRHVWKHDNPLHRKEKSTLARILNEGTVADVTQKNAQNGTWSTKIHFLWDVVANKLLQAGLRNEPKAASHMSFADFWEECIDNTLFAVASSDERKYWGFLLLQRVIQDAPAKVIPTMFSKNLLRCLINQLSVSDRTLHLAAQRAIKTALERATSGPDSRTAILKGLLTPPIGNLNFDRITNTKTVENLLSQNYHSDAKGLIEFYETLLLRPGVEDEKGSATRRQAAADQLVSAVRNVPLELSDNGQHHQNDLDFIRTVLRLFSKYAYFDIARPEPPINQPTREMFGTRISSCLAYIISRPGNSAEICYNLIRTIRDGGDDSDFGTPLLKADDTIREVLTHAWDILDNAILSHEARSSDSSKTSYYRSIKLLYSLTILEVYNEHADAVGILGELNGCFEGLLHNRTVDSASATLIEIILSFVSKPSKLFRQLANQVFEVCAPNVDDIGLQSMIEILETKENLSGQAELFENEDDEENAKTEESDPSEASDVESVDMAGIDPEDSASEDTGEDDTSDESSSSGDDVDGDDVEASDGELAAFDAKLAQALGTRPGVHQSDGEESSSSDEDMNSEQMEALDEHLETVFRERKKLTSRSKKTEKKEAKENIVNFKCRVLELLEIYVKQQHATVLALDVLLPVLTVIRTTRSPLVSAKGCELIREYSRLCRGRWIPRVADSDPVFETLHAVHDEARKEASNAHASACGQAGLLLARVLVAKDKENVRRIKEIYESLESKNTDDSSRKVKDKFFVGWKDWCNSAEK